VAVLGLETRYSGLAGGGEAIGHGQRDLAAPGGQKLAESSFGSMARQGGIADDQQI
jgi:hypothetical protein